MTKKIEWYQEVLSLEPGSKVFFALAKLFVETGQLEAAVNTLRQGLDRHPDFLEARLLLAQVLVRLERPGEAALAVEPVTRALRVYPDFWRLWAQSVVDVQRDFAVFLMLVASHFTEKPVQWMDVVLEGVNSLSTRLVGPPPPPAEPAPARFVPTVPQARAETPDEAQAADAALRFPGAGSLRTRTMADLPASQGDYTGALAIYKELWMGAQPGFEREDLAGRIEKMEAELREGTPASRPGVEAEDAFSRHAKNRLIGTLEALAARFEARVRA